MGATRTGTGTGTGTAITDGTGRTDATAAPSEAALRARLGIPPDARQVLIVTESSHWDTDWLLTSEEYFRVRVRRILDRALDELRREPRRVFDVEATFYPRLYLDRVPARADEFRTLVNEGRLRFTGTAVTTPDTLLPTAEALLRDYLTGQEWLRANGMAAEPRVAHLPDSFGHSPALPSLLRALGVDACAVTRVDGMYFPGTEWEPRGNYPRPGSSAEQLLADATLDFVWRDRAGAEVLTHWNAFGYGHGELLAARGLSRWMGLPLAVPDRRETHVAARLERFAADLAPVSRTPYLLCPSGFDFVMPIRGLVVLLDRHNAHRYPDTGLWAVNAGLDDYLALVACHRDQLPVHTFDPNPYWTGFYSARRTTKQACRALVDDLLLAETLAVDQAARTGDRALARRVAAELAPAWHTAVATNHHDFVTGTSPDRVVRAEQRPWVDAARGTARAVLAGLAATAPAPSPAPTPALAEAAGAPGATPEATSVAVRIPTATAPTGAATPPAGGGRTTATGATRGVRWRRDGDRVEVETPWLRAAVDARAGGCLTAVTDATTGAALLRGPSNDLVCHRDSGGLWRMGHEFRGGTFAEAGTTADRPAVVDIVEHDGAVEVVVTADLDGRPTTRRLWFAADRPVLRLRVTASAHDRRTVTVRLLAATPLERLVMDQPAGWCERPVRKLYDPTFWPVQSFVHARPGMPPRDGDVAADEARGGAVAEGGAGGGAAPGGLALAVDGPCAVAARAHGAIDVVVARNALKEIAHGWAPFVGLPAKGREPGDVGLDYAVWFPVVAGGAAAPADAAALHTAARDALAPPPGGHDPDAAARDRVEAVVTVDRDDVWVAAVKPAARGDGVIVRLGTLAATGAQVRLRATSLPVVAARRCDARERDLGPLPVIDGAVRLDLPGAIATVRLLLDDPDPAGAV